MKNKIFSVLFIIMFIAGFGILVYPTVANQWNTYVQSQLITEYETALEDMTEYDYSNEWAAARAFDDKITVNEIYADVFGEDAGEEEFRNSEYFKVLNLSGDGVMGYLTIPKINVALSIYHGTNDRDLQTGLGHLNGTSLPIGGESTHSVIAGHRGLPTGKLFTDIDQLEAGDKFYIHVLGETLAYQVDQILPMVDAEDRETLEEALKISEGHDYVTLFTCTPYGVNTHRLLVRGTRVEYLGEDEVPTGAEAVVAAAKDYYMIFLIAGLIVAFILITIIGLVMKARRSREESSEIK